MPHHRIAGERRVQMIRLELLHLSDCPHTDSARQLLYACLGELGVEADIEELEGAFPSPTIRVNGEDVMGPPPSAVPACRLDVPTRERVLAALRGATT